MLQKINFTKGIDSDTSAELFQLGFGRNRLNARVMSSDTADNQSAEAVLGNVLVPFTLPTGNNTVIGSYESQLQKKVYYFLYNDAFHHSILEYDQVTNTIAYVLTLSALNFDINHLITGINVVRKTDTEYLLYWTDNFNAPRKINIYRAKLYMQGDFINGYASPFDPELLYRIKQPPLFPPTYTWTGNSVNTEVVNATSGTLIVGGLIDIPYVQSPVIPEFNNSTHQFIVGTAGPYDLSVFLNFSVNTGVKLLLIKNSVIINSQNIHTTSFAFTYPSLSLNIGDHIWWQLVPMGSGPSVIHLSSATFKADLITGVLNGKPNYLFNKLYQFQYRYFCDDYEFTSASPMSGYVFPQTTMDYVTEDNVVSQDNQIIIALNTGNNSVTKMQVWAKEYSQTAFTIIDTIDKKELGLSDNSIYLYSFFGNNIQLPIVDNDQTKLFDNVPLKSQSQEIINNARIVDGFITEGFNPVTINTRLNISYRLVDSWTNNGHYPKLSYLKSGGKWTYGIVYYNHANQSGVTNISNWKFDTQNNGIYGTELNIPFVNEDTYTHLGRSDGTFMQYVPIVSMTINHFPPAWATHYQIVRSKELSYSKYLQFIANDINYFNESGGATSLTGTKIHVDLSNLVGTGATAYNKLNPNSILVYDFTKGDRIRFIANRNTSTNTSLNGGLLEYNDTAIDSFDGTTGTLILTIPSNTNPSTDPLRNLGAGCFFEIYTPSLSATVSEIETFEIVECFPILPGAGSLRYHGGNIQNQDSLLPAIIEISGGDSFRRQQYMPHLQGNLHDSNFVESQNVNNMFLSMASNEGRPNRVDPSFKEIIRPSTIYYSEQFIPETFINGLSTVYDLNSETYNQDYGGIYKLFSTNDSLLVFQELKIGQVPIERIIYDQLQGGNTVGASEKVLSPQAKYYLEEYGIGVYPESFAKYGAAKYGIDVRRGVVWRLSNDGLTPISEYFQHIYFTALCKKILQSSQKVKIYGVYDKRFNEYIISVSAFIYNGINVPAQTIAFNEKENLWSTLYSYAPENMVTNGMNIITYKNGQLWKHNENPIVNNFYGVQYPSMLEFYCNESPSNIKVYEAISLEALDAWDVVIETPITNENPNGQHTELITSNFQMKEGFWYSEILKDDLTPNNVVDPFRPYLPNARFEGNPMRGKYALIRLTYNGTTFTKIFAANINIIGSDRSNA